jgi:hypothetical protein
MTDIRDQADHDEDGGARRARPAMLRVPPPARRSLLRGSALRLRLTATSFEGGRVTRTSSVRIGRVR